MGREVAVRADERLRWETWYSGGPGSTVRTQLVPEVTASLLKFGIRFSEEKHKLQIYILNIVEV